MFMERVWIKVADWLPKSLVYWAAIRLMFHATTGKYSRDIPDDVSIMTALDRWERMNN